MRQKKVKRLRKTVYGDYAQRQTSYKMLDNGQIVATGRRRVFQDAKKAAPISIKR